MVQTELMQFDQKIKITTKKSFERNIVNVLSFQMYVGVHINLYNAAKLRDTSRNFYSREKNPIL